MTDKITIERETLERAIADYDSAAGNDGTLLSWNRARDNLLALLRAALAAQPAEPDMRHPKIQVLIGKNARQHIWMMLVEQLVEDPNFETTSMDMEYWDTLHDKLKEKLTAQPAPAAVPPGMALVPIEPTQAMISAMMTSEARDAEGPFPMLMDHLDYGGENKSHTVLKAAYRAMIAAAGDKP